MDQVTWYVGIDWGSESHAVCVVDAAGLRREERRVDHTVEAVQACLDSGDVVYRRPAIPIAVAIETPRGALVDSCLARGWRLRGRSRASIAFATAIRSRVRKTTGGMRGSWRIRCAPTRARSNRFTKRIPLWCSFGSSRVQRKPWTRSFAGSPINYEVRCTAWCPTCWRCVRARMNRGFGHCCSSRPRPRRNAA